MDLDYLVSLLSDLRSSLTPLMIGFLAAVLTCITYDIVKYTWRPIDERVEAMRVIQNQRRRSKWVRDYLSWAIVEAFEESLHVGKVTRAELDHYYQLIGSRCHMPALLPKGPMVNYPDTEKLKKAIQSRIKGKLNSKVKIIGKDPMLFVHRQKPGGNHGA